MPQPIRTFRSAAMLLTVLFALETANADASAKAAAEALFRDAKALMEKGNYAAACPKLEESLRLEHSSGTLLRLGYCLEQLGKYASAWALYRQALPEVKAAGHAQRIKFANDRIAIVEPKLSRITIVLPEGAAKANIELDGKPFAAGNDLPVDGGSHTLTVTAEGYAAWSTTFEIAKEGGRTTITVPPFAKADPATPPVVAPVPAPPPPVAPAAPPVVAPVPTAPPPTRPPEAPPAPSSPSKVPAIVAFSAAGFFALSFAGARVMESRAYGDYTEVCARQRTFTCEADEEKTAVRRWEAISWVSAALGVVSAGVGIVLLVRASPSKHSSAALTLSPTVGATNGLALNGTF